MPTMLEQIQRARSRVRLELANRAVLLNIHGTFAITVGSMMAWTGAPTPVEGWFGPWARVIIGSVAVLLGLAVVWGDFLTDNDPKGYALLVGGMGGMVLWHSALTVAYGFAAIQEDVTFLSPGEHLSADVVSRGYIPFVYLTLAMLVLTHWVTLVRLGKPPR